jgi:glycosyltransferase involved in cell wall biosynthesis
MARGVSRAYVLLVDVDSQIPEFNASDFEQAWVVMCRHGVPRSIDIVDLSDDEHVVLHRLGELAARVRTATSSEPEVPVHDAELPSISVVVPTIAIRTEDLAACVDAIGRLDYPKFEVVLVDNRRAVPADDQLARLALDRDWLRVVREARPGISAARNAGVKASSGTLVAFTDDDVRVDPRWLRAIGERFVREPTLDALTGLVLPGELETPAQVWFENYYGGFAGERVFTPVTVRADPTRKGLLRASRVEVLDESGNAQRNFSIYGIGAYGAGSNMTFRRSAIGRIGGFDVALGTGTPSRGGEDLAALVSVLWTGGRLGYEPAAFIFHRHRRGYDELLEQMDGYGTGFTAMLTSSVVHSPRHLASIASRIPAAAKALLTQGRNRVRGRGPSAVDDLSATNLYPPELYRRESRATFRGPYAYLQSRLVWRQVMRRPRTDQTP